MEAANNSNEYFDLGSWQTWNFMDWGAKSSVNTEKLNTYLDTYATSLKAQGLSTTTFSFAQVGDIAAIASGDFSNLKTDDALGMLAKNTGDLKIGDQSVFGYIVSRLAQDGIKSNLSFGGAVAGTVAGDWNFGFSATQTPAKLASTLATWAKSIGLSGIDFDIETSAVKPLGQNNPQDVATFFHDLHSTGLQTTFTVMGDVPMWGLDGTVFKSIFSAAKDQGWNFTDMFNSLNLMLYNGQYYLNAGQTPHQSWDLGDWVKQLEQNSDLSAPDAGKLINVGFNAKINYADPASSGGPLPYTNMPSGLTSGQAAGYIYLQLEKDLGVTLGTPFFWDDNADYDVQQGDQAGAGTSHFFDNTGNFEKDFFAYIASQST